MSKFWPHYRHAPDLGSSPALRVYTIHREIFREFMAKFWPHYGHVPDLGFSPSLHVYTIHREISSPPLIVGNSWPNFGHFAVAAVRVH